MLKKTMAFLLAFCLAPELLPSSGGGGAAYAQSDVEVLIVTAKRIRDDAQEKLRECREGASNLAQMLGCNSLQKAVLRAEEDVARQAAALLADRKRVQACRAARDYAKSVGAVGGALGGLVCPVHLATRVICGAAVGAAVAACTDIAVAD